MSDRERIQGVWRLEACSCEGELEDSEVTHIVFRDDRTWEAGSPVVHYQDEPEIRSTFELDPRASPRRITRRTGWFEQEGGRVARRRTEHGLYRLSGDQLWIAWSLDPTEPLQKGAVDDDDALLETYAREEDPDVRRRVEDPPTPVPRRIREHSDLGRLAWDANSSCWNASWNLEGPSTARVSFELQGGEHATDEAFAAAASTLAALAVALPDIKRHAASELLDLKNTTWLAEGEERIDRKRFVAALRLDRVTAYEEGEVELLFDDGDLFWGHTIVVSLDSRLRPAHVELSG